MAPNHDERLAAIAGESKTGQIVTAAKRLLASWQRSEEYGVSAETATPTWAGSIESDSLFFRCGKEVLIALHRTLANEPLSLMLTDADGLVLNRLSGDTSLLRALDKVYLAPGFAFSERDAGTNGLGLALADRTPTLVRAEEHYSASLRSYTCAAVPVFDPVTGCLEGSVNITTWSKSSPELLLALVQSAASNTSTLMLARSNGRTEKPAPKGGVFRVQRGRFEPGSGTMRAMSARWTEALDHATRALTAGRVVAAVGEPGTGRATLLGQAIRQAHPRSRILCAAAPAPEDVDAWLSLWTPELAKPETAVIVENVDSLPAWAAQSLQDRAAEALRSVPVSPTGGPPRITWALTAEDLAVVPQPLSAIVDTVVPIPSLRERTDDVLPLARYAARQTRLRNVDFTAAAERVLTGYDWPGNIDELFRLIHAAALRTETIEVHHLPAALVGTPGPHLTRIESVERDEIIRCLSRPGTTVAAAAAELGLSRATIYRRMARLGITMPR
ncbi:transcriptional regulator of acetoin/glycerol metabolism [Arthrobacter sp. PvP102]|uniref:helix-turn-helix domain-containing protein n=1 Tax=unclassified Arthrobacter TaxID=235627 RepID=UPI001AE6F1D3|nr:MULTISPECIES: helix-turn-helix domain-containing protein [unclassified Arthrobacter]MBP1232646.1 transcriptional regulator of acetoin/glycerol metabolism [Arthrobacter sp. PvP103]MBP1237781.1 transcriptional regulator of acetoin/glycerol metabolism [Arthrobacter sp. PvP102]